MNEHENFYAKGFIQDIKETGTVEKLESGLMKIMKDNDCTVNKTVLGYSDVNLPEEEKRSKYPLCVYTQLVDPKYTASIPVIPVVEARLHEIKESIEFGVQHKN